MMLVNFNQREEEKTVYYYNNYSSRQDPKDCTIVKLRFFRKYLNSFFSMQFLKSKYAYLENVHNNIIIVDDTTTTFDVKIEKENPMPDIYEDKYVYIKKKTPT